MRKFLLSTFLISTFCVLSFAQDNKSIEFGEIKKIPTRTITENEVVIKVTGKYYPQDLIENFAPQGGKIKYFVKEGDRVEKKDKIASMISKELEAIEKVTLKYHDKEVRNWSNIYPTADIFAKKGGFVLKLEKENYADVYEGEKIITIAKQNYLAVENIEKMRIKPIKGTKVLLESKKSDREIEAIIKSFVKKEDGFYKFKLAVVSRNVPLVLDDEFIGEILINKENLIEIDKDAVISHKGRNYVLNVQEVTPIIETEGKLKVKVLDDKEDIILPNSISFKTEGE